MACPICLDLMLSATVTLCGHTFCERCIFEWNVFNKDCPVCRQSVRHEVPCSCVMIDSLIESYLELPSKAKEREKFRERKEVFEEWKALRTYFGRSQVVSKAQYRAPT